MGNKDSIDVRHCHVLDRLREFGFESDTATSDKWLLLEGACSRGVQGLLGTRSGGVEVLQGLGLEVEVLQGLGLEVECTAGEGAIAFCSGLE
jgi:hypothetical protein